MRKPVKICAGAARGESVREVRGGSNSAVIPMTVLTKPFPSLGGLYTESESGYDKVLSDGSPITAFADALTYLTGNAGDFFFFADTNMDTSAGYTIAAGRGLTLRGLSAPRAINHRATTAAFTVNANAKLTLDKNITIQGGFVDSTNPLVRISGGTFTMKDGSGVKGNRYVGVYSNFGPTGGGVSVGGGNFYMEGGEISGNTVRSFTSPYKAYSGGVHVSGSGTFEMTGGTISGNTAEARAGGEFGVYAYGGGVGVAGTGQFILKGGTIKGNKAIAITTYSSHVYGGGVYVADSGKFIMEGGFLEGNSGQQWGYSYPYSSIGGGVCLFGAVQFVKTGGTIYGTGAGGKSNTLVVASQDGGNFSSITESAVFGGSTSMIRNSTAGPLDDMRYNDPEGKPNEGWGL